MKTSSTTSKPKVRNRFDRRRRTVILGDAPASVLTQQQFKDECDMNRIVRNAQRGVPPRFTAQGEPHYGDFSSVPDLTEAYAITARAEEAFMTLPAALRAELDNDPRNIGALTLDQVDRYKLGKVLPSPSNPLEGLPAPVPAGQAEPAGTEPAAPPAARPDQKGRSKSTP